MEARPLPELLRERRKERGSSLRGAAKNLGVDPSYLSGLERGEKAAAAQCGELLRVSEEERALAEGKLLPTSLKACARIQT